MPGRVLLWNRTTGPGCSAPSFTMQLVMSP
jgi:hypothetical protein